MTSTNTIYLDMDGVVADWDAEVANFLGRPQPRMDPKTYYKNTPEEWARIKGHHRIYSLLPVMPRALELVSIARAYRLHLDWELKFLTAVPHDDDVPWAFWDKCTWAAKHFPDIPVMFGPHSVDKWRHCQPGDILVDDRPDNCESWTKAGGLAIKVDVSLDSAILELGADLDRRLVALIDSGNAQGGGWDWRSARGSYEVADNVGNNSGS